jgi:hypothetical protein
MHASSISQRLCRTDVPRFISVSMIKEFTMRKEQSYQSGADTYLVLKPEGKSAPFILKEYEGF